jgi:DnaJ homolog subfamily C member 2
MCREEKRFYQRENERVLSQMRRQEQKRVRTLVDRARTNDPRLRKKREEEEAKREADKREREAEKQRLIDEDRRRRDDLAEKERKAQEERQRAIIEAKNNAKSAAQTVQKFLDANGLLDQTKTNLLLPNLVRYPNIQWFFNKATIEEAEEMRKTVTEASTIAVGTDVPAVTEFNRLIEQKEQRICVNRYGEPIKRKPVVVAPVVVAAPVAEKPKVVEVKEVPTSKWSDDDVILLQKAIAKYPGGTVDRWRRIAVMMREKFTDEEVLVKTKELESAPKGGGAHTAATPATAPDATPAPAAPAAAAVAEATTVEDWTPAQQKQLEIGLRELKDYKEKDKFQKVAANVEGKNPKQCFDRYKFLCTLKKS